MDNMKKDEEYLIMDEENDNAEYMADLLSTIAALRSVWHLIPSFENEELMKE